MRSNEYYLAESLEKALSKLREDNKNVIYAGGLWIKKTSQSYNCIIDISSLGLDYIKENPDSVEIGSMTSLKEIEDSKIIKGIANGLINKVMKSIMGPAFRNSATIGGSIFGRFPFSDVICGLLVLDVDLIFYPNLKISLIDWIKYNSKPSFILEKIIIHKSKAKTYFKKVSATELDFAILNVAISNENNNIKIAIGARPAIANLCQEAMKLANNKASIEEISDLASKELLLIDNIDASKDYRQTLAKVYVKRGLKEVL